MDRLKAIWRDPVWATVVGGLILAAILAVLVTIYPDVGSFWRDVVSASKSAFAFVTASTLTPNWLLGLFILAALVLAWAILETCRDHLTASTSKIPPTSYLNYTSDNFIGLRWRWSYAGSQLQGLKSYCPSCDCLIDPKAKESLYSLRETEFYCDLCNKSMHMTNEHPFELERKIYKFIDQKIRSGSWQPLVTPKENTSKI